MKEDEHKLATMKDKNSITV